MCGIAAISIAKKDITINPTTLAQALLKGLESRGRDASGVAWHTRAGDTYVLKQDVAGSQLAKTIDLTDATEIIIHTRWATQGSPTVEANNHPIDVSGIVGVHNGHCRNDDALLAQCKGYTRKGRVDSEAIFALLAHGPDKRSTLDRLSMVEGNAAVAWLQSYDAAAGINLARITSSPLVIANTAGGSFVAASTGHHLFQAAHATGIRLWGVEDVPEGTHMTVRRGRVDEWHAFTPRHYAEQQAHNYNQRSLWEVTA